MAKDASRADNYKDLVKSMLFVSNLYLLSESVAMLISSGVAIKPAFNVFDGTEDVSNVLEGLQNGDFLQLVAMIVCLASVALVISACKHYPVAVVNIGMSAYLLQHLGETHPFITGIIDLSGSNLTGLKTHAIRTLAFSVISVFFW
eukprot:GFYU01002298.1.p1 GENE.GFYU01002298.1~~GFYU01002298.1.p1  ORF type:complete len:146 (+),score=17.79 GFYU01002298.1:168-605(+)